MSAKEPVEKLPLAVRKNVRDEFEADREDLESQISKLLGGQQWKIEVNPNLIYAYAEEGSYGHQSLGDCMKAYIDGAIYRLKYFLESQDHGEEGVAEINKLASTHTITIYPDLEKKNSYCGVDIKGGVLRILFREGNLGTNVDNALEHLENALNEAAPADSSELSYTARNSIKRDWDKDAETLRKDIAEQVHNDNIKLNPNFAAVVEKLKTGKDVRDDWAANLGAFTKKYFESVAYYLKCNKFKEDDLMYEGFNEVVTGNEIIFRVVDKVTGPSSYNQCLVEDGKLVLQTTPSNFGTNVDYIAEKIVDVL
ncbi:uncharacterized protein PV09_06137 [Verruconis gallopava]|uniref:Uncharacterized protein n=1 Tax=Verruconis gallopava TaxID=253628 RepID=A0A0D2AU77_9PEZI|nr:uncharacterized protein PV09_06137 [Verruconis gallopava]KIW02699.1 hypothetical protein PV09_06137 [Verruconis gallopava]